MFTTPLETEIIIIKEHTIMMGSRTEVYQKVSTLIIRRIGSFSGEDGFFNERAKIKWINENEFIITLNEDTNDRIIEYIFVIN